MRMSFFRAAVLAGFAVAGMSGAAPAFAEGAIAHGNDGHVGMSWGLRHREAEERALRECGGRSCEIVGRFERQCAAIAVGRRGAYGWAVHARPNQAETDAVRQCQRHDGIDCVVVLHGCDA